jgi:hypothetical protein
VAGISSSSVLRGVRRSPSCERDLMDLSAFSCFAAELLGRGRKYCIRILIDKIIQALWGGAKVSH